MNKPLIVLVTIFSPIVFAKKIPLTIYHTNDLHSHFEGVKTKTSNGNDFIVKGRFDRLSTAIQKIRNEKISKNEIAIGVDAGDFFAGTVFSALAPSTNNKSFPEFEYLDQNNFDVITLGNHEFDATNMGLETMFQKAKNFKGQSQIVATNLIVNNSSSSLKKYIGNDSLIKDVVIKEYKSGNDILKVAFLGLLGPDACLVSKATRGDVSFVGFNDKKSKADLGELADFFSKKIDQLKKNNGVDIVVVSMHGGGEEAAQIVKKIKGVDVVIAGHTHEVERKVIDGKILSQTGDYGQNLGVLELNFDTETHKVSLQDENKSSLIAINDSISPDLNWTKKIKAWKQQSFELMGQEISTADDVIFTSDRDYKRGSVIQNELGVMLSSRMLEELNLNNVNADFYFTSMGLVRASIEKGVPMTKADIFEIVGIGYDKNLKPGVPTVTFFLTGKEVKSLINFLELYSHVSKNFAPVFSNNVKFEVSKYGVPFLNRIKNLNINNKELNDDHLYKIATNQYVINNLDTIESATHGLVKIDPKNEKGESTRSYETHAKEYELLIESFGKK